MDRAKLAKLLAMTTSANDHEALAALRRANAMLKAADQTWADVLSSQTTISIGFVDRDPPWTHDMTPKPSPQTDEPWVPPHLQNVDVIQMMLAKVNEQPRVGHEDFWEFVDNCKKRVERHGNLTQGQYNALRRCYARAVRARA